MESAQRHLLPVTGPSVLHHCVDMKTTTTPSPEARVVGGACCVHVTQRELDDVVVASNKTAHDRVLPREELLPVARNVSQADDISSVGFTSLRLAALGHL